MSREVFIYALCEPDEPWNVRYVGKVLARSGEGARQAITRRLQWHVYECRRPSGRTHRHNWLRSLGEHAPCWRLLDVADQRTWEEMERFYIAAHRAAGFDLLNATHGGDGVGGYAVTAEARRKISSALTGRKQRPEWVAKRTAGQTGRKRSAEVRAKISAARKGQSPWNKEGWVPPDHMRQAVSEANKGRKWSPESIAKREATKQARRANGDYASGKGRPKPQEAIEKTRAANRGRKRTPEQRAHLSEGQRRRWAAHPVTRCVHGHAYTPENTYVDPRGRRRCRTCRAASWTRARHPDSG